jgi:hypothetical protein
MGRILRLALLALALATVAAPAHAEVFRLEGPTSPTLPIFKGGKAVDMFDNQAKFNIAMMHAGWSLVLPLAGEKIGGRKGLWVAGLTWLALATVEQTLFQPRATPAEHRSDVLTKLVPCMTLLAVDAIRHGLR